MKKKYEKGCIDKVLLADVLTGIDNFLDEHNKTLANKYKAELAVILYEFMREKGG